MITLDSRLANPLDNLLQFLGWRDDPRLNELELGGKCLAQLLHERLILANVLKRDLSLRVLAGQVILGTKRRKELSE